MIITRRAFTTALSLTGLAALAGLSPLRLITDAFAQTAAEVAKPQSLPDMGLGPQDAKVTIVEYASMTCPHCANFNETVFPKIKSTYVDSGKVRYVFREFPLDIKAAAGSMLARCIAKDDAPKFFAVIDLLFRQQNDWVVKNTTETLTRIGKQAGLSQQQVEDCLKDQKLLDKIAADQAAVDAWAARWIVPGFDALEALVGRHGAGRRRPLRHADPGLAGLPLRGRGAVRGHAGPDERLARPARRLARRYLGVLRARIYRSQSALRRGCRTA